MQKDTRSRNQYFSMSDISEYRKEYADALKTGLNAVSGDELIKAEKILRLNPSYGNKVYVAGNGGSAAICDHLTCDFVKGTKIGSGPSINVHSLVGGQALFTAIANDLGYEKTFSYQLEAYGINELDILILVSSSGNSFNILDAMNIAKAKRAKVIGLTGFDGGKLRKEADISLHVPIHNYGVVEDCHMSLMHILAQFRYLKKLSENEESKHNW